MIPLIFLTNPGFIVLKLYFLVAISGTTLAKPLFGD